jgi:predicted O-methyltransferase YrrM
VPADFAAVAARAWEHVRATPGHLTEREARFLMLAAACTPADGVILEIGSFKGKSTVGLATVAAHYGRGAVVAVDPHTAPAATDPSLAGQRSTWDAFRAALRAAGVVAAVEAHRAFSRDLAQGWSRPIRLLWIDGDHTYAGAKGDLELFRRHLAPGGVVALHDALNTFEGPIRVFVEELLSSDDFGPAGMVGSIGWAQYRPGAGAAHRPARERLARRAGRLIPFMARLEGGRELRAWDKVRYKLWRRFVPHAGMHPESWVAAVS